MFIVFAGDTYYPGGGWNDYKGEFFSMDAAYEAVIRGNYDWWQIVSGGEIVQSGGNN